MNALEISRSGNAQPNLADFVFAWTPAALHPSMVSSRKNKVKYRTFVHRGLGPYPAAVALDDTAHNGEADTGTLEIVSTVESLENSKEFVRVPHVEACAIVLNEIGILAAFRSAPYLHLRMLPLASELDAIGEQVDEYLFEQ